MAQINKIFMAGNLVRDPENMQAGSSNLTKFTIASSRKFKEQEEVCYIEVTTWGYLADKCEANLKKGNPVVVEGRLKLDTWLGKDGKQNSKHIIIAENVEILLRNKARNQEQEVLATRDF